MPTIWQPLGLATNNHHFERLYTMKQYSFSIVHKTLSQSNTVRATAASPEIARAQIVLMYGDQYIVADLPCGIMLAHCIHGEIDCSDFPESDKPWLFAQSELIEAV
jgi:hypothetical protein